jgi:hypothetical protein
VRELIGGLKTMQILGQVLKNFPGQLEGPLKERIATECYLLGFRALGRVMRHLREGQRDLVQDAVRAIQARRPTDDAEKVLRAANNVVYGLGLLCSYGVIKRISAAVGSPELERTYEKVSQALDSNATRLVNTSIRLDLAQFPVGDIVRFSERIKGEPLSLGVLRWLVLSHVNLHPVKLAARQKVFDAVDIAPSEKIGTNLAQRVLGPGRRR